MVYCTGAGITSERVIARVRAQGGKKQFGENAAYTPPKGALIQTIGETGKGEKEPPDLSNS